MPFIDFKNFKVLWKEASSKYDENYGKETMEPTL